MNKEIKPQQNSAIDEYRQEVSSNVYEFMKKNSLLYIVGISGGADHIAEKKAEWIITEFIHGIKDMPYAILTGGTQGGIPEIGTKIAKSQKVPTIGIFPEQGKKYALYNDLDLAIQTYPPAIGAGTFGSETPSFVNLLNGAAVIGGSFGTLTEVSTILKTNTGRIKKKEGLIYLCPIKGTGGVADAIGNLPGMENLTQCLPEYEIRDGLNAARFFRSRLTTYADRIPASVTA